MKLIPLTQGKFAQVDDDDYEYLMQWKWCAHKGTGTFYAERTALINDVWKGIRMHRLIMKAEKGQIIDHKDRNGLNNQKHNLRFCTKTQNNINRRSSRNGTSKYLGVYILTTKKTCGTYYYWASKIRHNKIPIHLGIFKTEIEAAQAYNAAAIKYHGEFANINIIDQSI